MSAGVRSENQSQGSYDGRDEGGAETTTLERESMRRLSTVEDQRGDATEVSQCCGSQPRTGRHNATSQQQANKFDLFMPTLNTQYHKHDANDADELERDGLFKKLKARVATHDDQSKKHYHGGAIG